jgi:hypothetical protein
MRVFGRLLVVSLGLLIAVVIQAQQQPDESIANAFYPQFLDDVFRDNHAPGVEVMRRSVSMRADLDRSGHADYLIVAYWNGLGSVVRIIRVTDPANAVLVAESPDRTMGGDGGPRLEAVDIDNDGVPEIVVRFLRGTWVYKYRSGKLDLFGPTRRNRVGLTSDMSNPTFVDVDGDDVMEIIDHGSKLYKLGADGQFTRAATVAYNERFQRDAETVTGPDNRSFSAKPGKYVLHVLRRAGTDGGAILLNGKAIASSADFGARRRMLDIPVELLDRNDLSVTVDGGDGAELIVTVVPAQ